MIPKDNFLLEQAYRVIIKEFSDYDGDGVETDSWWWERSTSPQGASAATEPNYDTLKKQNDDFASVRANNSNKLTGQFNSYEQCNNLILSCETKSEIIRHFCEVINKITENNEEARTEFAAYVSQVTSACNQSSYPSSNT